MYKLQVIYFVLFTDGHGLKNGPPQGGGGGGYGYGPVRYLTDWTGNTSAIARGFPSLPSLRSNLHCAPDEDNSLQRRVSESATSRALRRSRTLGRFRGPIISKRRKRLICKDFLVSGASLVVSPLSVNLAVLGNVQCITCAILKSRNVPTVRVCWSRFSSRSSRCREQDERLREMPSSMIYDEIGLRHPPVRRVGDSYVWRWEQFPRKSRRIANGKFTCLRKVIESRAPSACTSRRLKPAPARSSLSPSALPQSAASVFPSPD